MKTFLFCFLFSALFYSCENTESEIKFTKEQLFKTVNSDSLYYNSKENYFIDKSEDSSGSLYKFNRNGYLVFYCFMNKPVYPYAEYFDDFGNRIRVEGNTFVQVRTSKNQDSSYTLTFLYSTLKKSNYTIKTFTSFGDTLSNVLSKANIYSNVGFFNVIIRSRTVALKTKFVNNVTYFDSISNKPNSFSDTVFLKDIL